MCPNIPSLVRFILLNFIILMSFHKVLFSLSKSLWKDINSFHKFFFFLNCAGFMRPLWKTKERLKKTRYFTYIFMSVWKIFCFVILILLARLYRGESVNHFFTLFHRGFSAHKIRITEVKNNKYFIIYCVLCHQMV